MLVLSMRRKANLTTFRDDRPAGVAVGEQRCLLLWRFAFIVETPKHFAWKPKPPTLSARELLFRDAHSLGSLVFYGSPKGLPADARDPPSFVATTFGKFREFPGPWIPTWSHLIGGDADRSTETGFDGQFVLMLSLGLANLRTPGSHRREPH
jgi:hypothetical protein